MYYSKHKKSLILLIFLIITFSIPTIACYLCLIQQKKLSNTVLRAFEVCRLLENSKQISKNNALACKHISSVNNNYVSTNIESIRLLEQEHTQLQKHVQSPSFISDMLIENRLASIKSNKLKFISKPYAPESKEIIHTLVSPAEIDSNDICSILNAIESSSNQSHIFLITEFKLERTLGLLGQETWHLSLQFLQRDISQYV